MPILKKLKELFDEAKISYEVYNHPLAYTAQEIAERQHFSGKEMAKVVMLEVDGGLIMAVVTASQKVRLNNIKANVAAHEVRLATEDEFISKFPDCGIGSMPPFGNLFGLPVYVHPAVETNRSTLTRATTCKQLSSDIRTLKSLSSRELSTWQKQSITERLDAGSPE